MKDLAKWQVISFISRGVAMLLGIIQSFVIIRLLSVAEWGTIQLAVSIGGALGIYQHLGLASASTREISAAKDDVHVFKIFVTSVLIRYFITIPIAFGLIFFSKYIAVGLYKNDGLTLPLQIYGVTLLFQGVQSILNSVISGTKRFKQLFTYQVLVSILSIVLYIPLILMFRIKGYFYAYFVFNVINSILLAIIAFKPLKGSLVWPSKQDFSGLFKEIFSISLAIYLVKIVTTNWEKFGTNILGVNHTPEVVAILAFALLYSKKIMSISDAVTDVTLPVLSEKYEKNISEFKETFAKNFNKVFSFIVLAATTALYWAPNIIDLVVGKNKYAASYPFILPILFAYVLYSFADIIKSSVLIPAKMTKEMMFGFVIMLLVTASVFFMFKNNFEALMLMSWSMSVGIVIAVVYLVISVYKKLKLVILDIDHIAILLQAFVIGAVGIYCSTWFKSLVFVPFMSLLVAGLSIAKYIYLAELIGIPQKLFSKLKLANK